MSLLSGQIFIDRHTSSRWTHVLFARGDVVLSSQSGALEVTKTDIHHVRRPLRLEAFPMRREPAPGPLYRCSDLSCAAADHHQHIKISTEPRQL
jgi:hypothetical protein